jgi:hypothetical protein
MDPATLVMPNHLPHQWLALLPLSLLCESYKDQSGICEFIQKTDTANFNLAI